MGDQDAATRLAQLCGPKICLHATSVLPCDTYASPRVSQNFVGCVALVCKAHLMCRGYAVFNVRLHRLRTDVKLHIVS